MVGLVWDGEGEELRMRGVGFEEDIGSMAEGYCGIGEFKRSVVPGWRRRFWRKSKKVR